MKKVCSKCKQEKLLTEFYKRLNSKGLNIGTSRCKECTQSQSRQWRLDNRERWDSYNYKHRQTKHFKEKQAKKWQERKASFSKGVYFIKALNGTYVGQSKNLEFRLGFHQFDKTGTTPIRGYISHEVLEYVEDEKLRKERERYWIKKLNPSLNVLQ